MTNMIEDTKKTNNTSLEAKIVSKTYGISSYNELLSRYSSYLDKDINNYKYVVKSVKYLYKNGFYSNEISNKLLKDFIAIYLSKYITDVISSNLVNSFESAFEGAKYGS